MLGATAIYEGDDEGSLIGGVRHDYSEVMAGRRVCR